MGRAGLGLKPVEVEAAVRNFRLASEFEHSAHSFKKEHKHDV